jgi:thioredoxin reductase (NADPH)
MQVNYDVIVIGGGPAGSAAASFTARSKWSTLVIDKSVEMGFLGSLGNVSYFPGFPESIRGRDILERMKRQAELVGVQWLSDAVVRIDGAAGAFKIIMQSGKGMEAKAVIVATGASDRTNYLHGEREFMGKGVSHDVLADGPAVARRGAAVIGKTDHAVREAIALARFAEHIHFIIPSSKLEVPDELLNRIKETKSIETHYSASLKKINGSDHVSSITVFTGGQEKEIPVVGVFTYIHEYKATTDFLNGFVETAQLGAIKVDEGLSTSVKGVFGCGDVLCGKPQMPAISAAQGLLAGVGVNAFLSSMHT